MELQADAVAPIGDGLTVAEQRAWRAAGTGALVDLRVGVAELDDPAGGASWGADRRVRAGLLVELLTGVRAVEGGRLRAVKLRGACISGRLDLEAVTLGCPLVLQGCYVEQPVSLKEARAPAIRLPGCHVAGLVADQLETRGDLELSDGFTTQGGVGLPGAHIGGQLDLSGARLANPDGPALAADRLTVDQSMFCQEGFTAQGQVRLPGAHISGQLSFNGATLTNPDGTALHADGLTVEGSMFCREGFTAQGGVRLLGAHISGQLDLNNATLVANPDGPALAADGLTVEGAMFCGEGFTAQGEVRLPGAHIGGQLNLSGANLVANPDGPALAADRLTVDQSVVCREGFTAQGEVRLLGAHIGGQLDLSGANLVANPDGPALAADGLTVEGGMVCGEGFTAQGQVRLLGAHIGGQLDLSGATLTNPDGLAVDLGGVRAGTLMLLFRQRPDGAVDLTNARVGSFLDDPATWPATLRLRGFVYETLENDRVKVRARLRWLRRHPGGYTPQLYEQLAAVYRRAGHDEAARQVAIAKQWHRRRALNPLGKLWNWLLYVTVGYGYRTWLAGLWLAGLWLVGTRVFDRAYPAHMLPAKQPAPGFHPAVYALDVLLPIVGLGQQGAWLPQGAALRWSWVLTGAGWVLTTAVVAGLAGVLKRD